METPTHSRRGPASPMGSPNRITRLQEKEDLSNLNNRLAVYIEKVRSLKMENDTLSERIEESESECNLKLNRMKDSYEAEIADVRKTLDSSNIERARLELALNEVQGENSDLKTRKESELETHQARLRDQEALLNTKTASLATVQGEKRALEEENKELKTQVYKLKGNLKDTKRQLQDETLHRTDICSRYESLKAELESEKNRLTEELRESNRRHELRITEISSRGQQEYDSKLAKALADMRLDQERQINNYKEDRERYLNSKLEGSRREADAAKEELHQMRMRLEDKCSQYSQLQQQLAATRNRVLELEGEMTRLEDQMRMRLDDKDREMAKMRQELEKKLSEYQDLMDVKVALDNEISAYKKMLELEEDRLYLSPSPRGRTIIRRRSSPIRPTFSSAERHSGTSGGKRQRVHYADDDESCVMDTSMGSGSSVSCTRIAQHASSKWQVVVDEVNLEGKYVRLHNQGDQDQSLGNWQIQRKVGSDITISYKFSSRYTLKAGQSVTIWAAEGGGTHNPPSDLVWKNQNSWGSGDQFQTILVNDKGEKIAVSSVRRTLFLQDDVQDMQNHSACMDDPSVHLEPGQPLSSTPRPASAPSGSSAS